MIFEAISVFVHYGNKRNLDDGLKSVHMRLDQKAFVDCSQIQRLRQV